MLEIRRYEPADHDIVWELHNLALNLVGAHGGNGPWDDDLHQVEEVYLRSGASSWSEPGRAGSSPWAP